MLMEQLTRRSLGNYVGAESSVSAGLRQRLKLVPCSHSFRQLFETLLGTFMLGLPFVE